ncbi:enzyme [gut metagenome]|uniref:Enzyme n=1 Tax=gut metagenome TaxID=749906 RepID=J9GME4_9ZZZZ
MPKLNALARQFHYYYLFLKRFCIFFNFKHQIKSKMANLFFQFKQFVVWHDKCGMKVGTDGVLLGAWASVSPAGSILDIGTGTGLVALMLAQRSPSDVFITALEIDSEAAVQASENVERSPWKERITVKEADFRTFRDGQFDVIVSNPPYFTDSLLCPNQQRSRARHNNSLTYEELIEGVSQLLSPAGVFSVVIPMNVANRMTKLAALKGLYPVRQLLVKTKPDAAPKRTLIAFSFSQGECKVEELLTEVARHQYSSEYIALTRDFYLKM